METSLQYFVCVFLARCSVYQVPFAASLGACIRPTALGTQEGTMKPKTIYLILCFIGLILTYWQFLPWVAQNGLNMPLFFHLLFANRISAFFGMDVFVSAAALLVFMRTEGSRLHVPGRWIPIVALIFVGVSLALPLFLYMRERRLEQPKPGLTGQPAR
jgi:hypothetical protein